MPMFIPVGLAVLALELGATMLVAAAIFAASSFVISEFLSPKPKMPDFDFGYRSEAQGRTTNVRQPIVPQRIVYGQARIGGNMIFYETTGDENELMHMVIALGSGGPYEEIGDIWLNDVVIRPEDLDDDGFVINAGSPTADVSPQFEDEDGNPLVRIKKHLGAWNQAADPDLIDETSLDSNFKGGGICYIYVRMKWDRDVFTTIPNVSAVVKGRKVYDMRGSPTEDPDDPDTWNYSSNSALVMLDYVRGVPTKNGGGTVVRKFGLGAEDSAIDFDAWSDAADVCDEPVQLRGSPEEEFENRYEAHGVIETSRKPFEAINDIRSSCAGDLIYSSGKWLPYVGTFSPPASSVELDEDDLRGPLKVTPKKARRDLVNSVKGTFVSEEAGWHLADYPPVSVASYVSDDNGEVIWGEYDLPMTKSTEAAERLSRTWLQISRRQISVEMPCKLTALRCRAGMVIGVSNTRYGWDNKSFFVNSYKLVSATDKEGNPYVGVDLTLQEIDSTMYDWNRDDAQGLTLPPKSTLRNPFAVAAPTDITLASGTNELFLRIDGTVFSRIKVSWTAPADIFVTSGGHIEVYYKKSSDSLWQKYGVVSGSATEIWILDVQDGVAYDIAVRSISNLGVRSDRGDPATWQQKFLSYTVVGKTETPPDVDTFNVARLSDGTRQFTWSLNPVPADVQTGGGYQIKYKAGTGHSWNDLVNLHEGLWALSPYETNQLGAGEYTFGIKAVDSSGNESTNALLFEATLGNPRQRDTLLYFDAYLEGWPIENDLPPFVQGSPSSTTDGLHYRGFVNYEGYFEGTGDDSGSPGVGDWSNLPSTWNGLRDEWVSVVENSWYSQYRTGVFDLGADIDFVPLINIEVPYGRDDVIYHYIRVHTDVQGDDFGKGSPLTTWQFSQAGFGQQYGRYLQYAVNVFKGPNPPDYTSAVLISGLTIIVDGEFQIEDFEDINTATYAGSDFESIATGHFKLSSRGTMSAIRTAGITAIQNVGQGWTWELINKDTTITGEPDVPAVEFKIYNSGGSLADAVIDATIKGLKI